MLKNKKVNNKINNKQIQNDKNQIFVMKMEEFHEII